MAEQKSRSILLVAQFSPPSFVVAARRVAGMTKYLARLGYSVTVVTSDVSGDGPIHGADAVIRTSDLLATPLNWRRVGAATTEQSAGIISPPSRFESVIVPDVSVVSWFPFALRAARELVRRKQFDCVITTSPPQSAHFVGVSLARRGLPWIAEFRDGWRFEPPGRDWPLRSQRKLDGRLEHSVATRADALVAVTQPIVADLENRFGRRVDLITNGFDPEDADTFAGSSTESVPVLSTAKRSVVHTGSIGFTGASVRPVAEGLSLLKEEAPEVARRLEIVFAGRLSSDEAKILGSSELSGLVRSVGALERASVLRLQRAADVLLVVTEGLKRPSVATGKLFEYLAAGRPILVLGAETEAARIVAATGRGAATSAHDPKEISAALRHLVEADWPTLTYSDEVKRYAWSALAADYAAVVDRVSSETPGD